MRVQLRCTLLTLLALALGRPFVALCVRMMLPDAAVSPEINYAAAMVQSLLLFALPGWLLRPTRLDMPEKREFPADWLLLPLVAAILARAVATPLNKWWAAMLGAPMTTLPPVEGTAGLLLMVLAVAIIPAVSEELFFRGALMGNLLQCGNRMQALLLTTAMFALMHGSLAGLPGHLIVSFLLSVLALRSGRLAEPVAAHLIFNLLAFVQWEPGALGVWACALLLCALTGWLLMGIRWPSAKKLLKTDRMLCAAILIVMGLQYLM